MPAALQSLPRSARLRAYAEMADLLWKGDQPELAIRLEELWSELHHRHSFALLYAYQASAHAGPRAPPRAPAG